MQCIRYSILLLIDFYNTCGLSVLDLKISLLSDYVPLCFFFFFFIFFCFPPIVPFVYTPEIPKHSTYRHIGEKKSNYLISITHIFVIDFWHLINRRVRHRSVYNAVNSLLFWFRLLNLPSISSSSFSINFVICSKEYITKNRRKKKNFKSNFRKLKINKRIEKNSQRKCCWKKSKQSQFDQSQRRFIFSRLSSIAERWSTDRCDSMLNGANQWRKIIWDLELEKIKLLETMIACKVKFCEQKICSYSWHQFNNTGQPCGTLCNLTFCANDKYEKYDCKQHKFFMFINNNFSGFRLNWKRGEREKKIATLISKKRRKEKRRRLSMDFKNTQIDEKIIFAYFVLFVESLLSFCGFWKVRSRPVRIL